MSTLDKLLSIKLDLSLRNHSRSDIMEEAVKTRLDKALDSYIKSIDASVHYLETRNDIKIMKRFNREG